MECPHCHGKLPTKECPHCQAEAPEEAKYCPACGGLMELPKVKPGDDSWENRILCSDGTCIGVIGPDGKCKVCGKPYQPGAAED